MNSLVKEKIANAPADPGVYLMKDENRKVIYVGKARALKKRLASYVSKSSRQDPKTVVLLTKVADLDTIVTGTEKEALILEYSLIKKYRPRYNVVLKDDKRYPSLRIDSRTDYPNIRIVRKIKRDGALYFGPFSSSHAVKETLKLIHKTFKIRKCKGDEVRRRDRPCLNFQMNACLAPCRMAVPTKEYQEIVDEILLFLKGKAPELIQKIRTEMTAAADEDNFEKAAELRDKMYALEKTLEKQVVVSQDFMDRDILGLASDNFFTTITLLSVRNGFMKGARNYHFSEVLSDESELLTSFIRQYYETLQFPPKELLVSTAIPDAGILEDFLRNSTGKKIYIRCPVRGEKKRLVDMAVQNAKIALKEEQTSSDAVNTLLHRLKKRLDLNRFPARIECYDNSNLSGENAVAAMVVFENGRPAKNAYRKYHIKTVRRPDDYQTMAEVLGRRFAGRGAKTTSDPFPDLVVVDGGKGQLNIAVDVLGRLDLVDAPDLVAIAKKDEQRGDAADKVYKPHRANAIQFGRDQDLLLFLQHIRDESHRFAITFHRQKRKACFLKSELDAIPGVGVKRKKILLRHFKSMKKIRAASLEELSGLPGMNQFAAESVFHAFNKGRSYSEIEPGAENEPG